MSDDPPPGVLGSLPHSRPHRRSAKRPPRAQPPPPSRTDSSTAAVGDGGLPGVVQTAVQAAFELTEIGARLGARTLCGALRRLPRP